MEDIEVLPHPLYSSDLVPYHLFHTMAHFLQRWELSSLEEIEASVRDVLASKHSEWYYKHLLALAEGWQKITESYGL